jgi:hypothetical protein
MTETRHKTRKHRKTYRRAGETKQIALAAQKQLRCRFLLLDLNPFRLIPLFWCFVLERLTAFAVPLQPKFLLELVFLFKSTARAVVTRGVDSRLGRAVDSFTLQNRFYSAAACPETVLWRGRWMTAGVSLPAGGDSFKQCGCRNESLNAVRASRTRFSDSCFFVLRARARGPAGTQAGVRHTGVSAVFSIPTFSRFDPTFSRLVLHFPGAIHRFTRQISGVSFA